MEVLELEIIAKRERDYKYKHIYKPRIDMGQSNLISRQHDLLEQTYCECKDNGESCENDKCSNVMDTTHCSPRCSSSCQNSWANDVNAENWMELFVLGTQDIGVGVRTKTEIRHGLIIGEYVGELVCATVYEKRKQNEYKNNKHFYGMFVDNETKGRGIIMDSTLAGNVTRFINHCSRVPNLEVEIWYSNGFPRIYFRALCDIPKGAELTYDYRAVSFDKDWNPEVCLCSNCTPNMNAKPFIPPLQNRSIQIAKESTHVPEKSVTTRSANSKMRLESVQVAIATGSTQSPLDSQNTTLNVELRDLRVPQNVTKNKVLTCDICDKKLSRDDSIFRHKKFVHFQTYSAIRCGVCSVSFSQQTNFKLHMKTYHPNVPYELPKADVPSKPFKCSQCERSYESRPSLKRHMSSCHPDMKLNSD